MSCRFGVYDIVSINGSGDDEFHVFSDIDAFNILDGTLVPIINLSRLTSLETMI